MAVATKTQLRTDYRQRRQVLEPAVRKRDSAIIRQRVLRLPAWQDAGTILCYVSYGHEVDTSQLIAEALHQKKRLIVPCTSPDGGETLLAELRQVSDLAPGHFKHILEPALAARKMIDPTEIELALIPGLAFDRRGARLGLGGGYFDRALPKMKNAVRVGLAFSAQIHPEPLPVDPHDVPMNAVVTEEEIIEPAPPLS